MINDLSLQLPALGEITIDMEGNYVRLVSSSVAGGRVQIKNEHGDNLVLTLGRGAILHPATRRLRLINLESAVNNITIVVGDRNDVDYSIVGDITGTVSVLNTRAAIHNHYMCASVGGPAAGQYWVYQIFNPAGSGVVVYVQSIRVQMPAVGALGIEMRSNATAIGMLDPNGIVQKRRGGPVAKAEFRNESRAGPPPGPLLAWHSYVQANRDIVLLDKDAIVLNQNMGVVITELNNLGYGINIELFEV